MSGRYQQTLQTLKNNPKRWLITGVAGFIGSNILEALLKLNQRVVGLDNFSTGLKKNLADVHLSVSEQQWSNFKFFEGDIRTLETCLIVCEEVDYVLHQAALGSIPRSIQNPIATNQNNVNGFLNMLVAARDSKVKSFTFASSSANYGDHPTLPKVEENIGRPLSPYAVSKLVNELYADVFSRTYGFNTIGLRYFNVFGRRQDPDSAYAAVIPKWIASMLKNESVYINGDGETSRDFCFIENTIQANILAATAEDAAKNRIYNIALNERTSLKMLFEYLQQSLNDNQVLYQKQPQFCEFRPGDIKHSLADINKARHYLGYDPQFKIKQGIDKTMPWYIINSNHSSEINAIGNSIATLELK